MELWILQKGVLQYSKFCMDDAWMRPTCTFCNSSYQDAVCWKVLNLFRCVNKLFYSHGFRSTTQMDDKNRVCMHTT